MPDHDEREQVAVLAASVERMAAEMKEVTAELRRTNDTLNSQQAENRVYRERMDRLAGEVWAQDNSSRIRTLEQHVKGLWGLVSFLVFTILGRLAPGIIHFFIYGK